MLTSCVGVVSFVELLYTDSENPSCEGRDVKQVAQISKYILMFVFAISQLNSALAISYNAIIDQFIYV